MNVAASVRAVKEKYPQDYCVEPRCLWRVNTRDGKKPCPIHMQTEPSTVRFGEAYLCQFPGLTPCNANRESGTAYCADHLTVMRREVVK